MLVNTNKVCEYRSTNGLCNGKACKTCHFDCKRNQGQEVATSVNYGAVKRYNQSKTGKVYRTEVMRF